MKITRRKFISSSALVSASLLLPRFLSVAGQRFAASSFNGRRLVIIQLSGGNDGLNTIVPFEDDNYYRLRPSLGLASEELIRIQDNIAWNASMQSLQELYDQGEVTIINNIGYPNPDLSHFRSMDIWQSASGSEKTINSGWIGRYLDSQCHNCKAHAALELDDTLSMALKGDEKNGLAVSDPTRFYKLTKKLFKEHSVATRFNSTNDALNYLYKVMAESAQSAEVIMEQSKSELLTGNYPQNGFGHDLKTVASLITSGLDSVFYYISLPGFDTHVNQKNNHNRILKSVADGIAAFSSDLKKVGEWNNTVIMVFSEFGRRVGQNASKGTDHGTANVLFLFGGSLQKKGVFNPVADLSKLDKGNLIYQIDFRSVYASLLADWLKADDEKILGMRFEKLGLV